MKHWLSKKKYEELKKELDELVGAGRREMGERLDTAKSFGDLSENAEYHQAREDQGKMETRIAELESLLKESEILKRTAYKTVQIGAQVTLVKKGCRKGDIFHIVDSSEANISEGRISIETPLVQAMLDKQKGDTFDFELPTGKKMSYKITEIK